MKYIKTYLIFFTSMIVLSGCALFTSHYDSIRHENFTKLAAFHEKFIHDFTQGSTKPWSLSSVNTVCDRGDLKYREALIYAASQDSKDGTGAKAVSNLKEQFEADCNLSRKRGKAFSKAWASEQLEQIKLNYGYAIAGELSRVSKSE